MLSNKKQNEHGTVSLGISIELEYTKLNSKPGQTVEVRVQKDAHLCIDPRFMRFEDSHTDIFSKVVEFQVNANKLLRKVRKLLSAGQYLKLSVTTSGYEDVAEYTEQTQFGPHKSTCRQLFFNLWTYEGNGHSDIDGADLDAKEGGIHLCADTRYTDERHDIWMPWNQDIFKTLEEAGI